jgi:cation transport ATPase
MPVLGVWYMIGFVFSSIFFAMEFLVSQTIHRHTKKFKKQSLEEEKKASDITDNEDDNEKQEVIVDLSRKKPLLAMYLGYFLMQMSVQMVFLIILFCYQRPLIKEHIWCSTHLCKGHYLCVLMGTQEKIMSITILATFSAVIMTFCVIFFLYIIHTYILVGITLSDRHRGSIKC